MFVTTGANIPNDSRPLQSLRIFLTHLKNLGLHYFEWLLGLGIGYWGCILNGMANPHQHQNTNEAKDVCSFLDSGCIRFLRGA